MTALLCGACASAPSTDRPVVDRPEVQRPAGVEPEGLADIRDSLGSQRAAARQADNTLNVSPSSMGSPNTPVWLDSTYHLIDSLLQAIGL